jgi:hypothetical protein
MSDGIYDFILAYYNPNKDGTPVAGADFKARLPHWPSTGLTFDGSAALPAGITSRNIGDVTASNSNRKGTTGGAFGTGQPNENFVGNITVPMANYLKSDAHIAAFKNTNIIGDGDKWHAWDGSSGKNGNVLTLTPTTNVGLIGDYGSLSAIEGAFHGVIDIKGMVPSSGISQSLDGKRGYINIWDNILHETFIGGFGVGYLHNSGGEYIISGAYGYPETYIGVVIYSKKYNKSALIGNATVGIGGLAPTHRAFVDNSDAVKLTDGNAAGGFDVEYRGQYPNLPVPALDEAAWITAGNNGTTPANLAANYASLDPQYKWDDQADLDSNAVASAAPANSPVQLASGPRRFFEAILPYAIRGKGREYDA